MTIKQWVKTPKAYVGFTLSAFLVIASIESRDMKGIYEAAIAVFVCLAADILFSSMGKRKRTLWDGPVITGLIVALILSTTSSWYVVAATSALAILSKYIFTSKKRPVFNPAAFGLLLSIPLFKSAQSWWGAFGDLPAWTVLFLLIGGFAVTNRVGKFPQVFSFLGTYFVLLLFMGLLHIGDAADALRSPFINMTLFFAMLMLTDPPTSPGKVKDQIVFGVISALVGITVYGCFGGLMYLFIGLLSGNLYCLLKSRNTLPAANRVTTAK
ncbi:RnfABCDGE type electron transport complex subunit D [Paenibacillus thalictri]|uniref:RnfABCDGE type electron transport complex subunit D n=1 Tax=Paenibacillus thalictri TaxID=2527873 RepID=A0A4Q9DDK9_9BACL|nr:RnfABCDGE type electron transport complex subunit D [Paenibacillus thalictri]TBL68326.1 hypothetical protein EYB31_38410 [Paenibacillus thalictri]